MANRQMVNEINKYGKARGYANMTLSGEMVIMQSALTLITAFDNLLLEDVPVWSKRNDIRKITDGIQTLRGLKFPLPCRELNQFKREYINRIEAVLSSIGKKDGDALFARSMGRFHATLVKYDSRIDKEVERFNQIMVKSADKAMQIDAEIAQTLITAVDEVLVDVANGVDRSEPTIVSV